VSAPSENQFSSKLDDQFFPTAVYHAFPLGKNKILIRLENTFDKFDLVNPMEKMGQVEPKFINMNQFAKDFYLEANPEESEAPAF